VLAALLIMARAVHIAASILIAGIFTFDVVVLGPSASDDLGEIKRRLLCLTVWGLIVAALSGLLWFWLAVANMSGLSLLEPFSGRALQSVLLQTRFGHVWQLRLGLIVVTFVLAVLGIAGNKVPQHLVALVLWLLSIVLLVSLAWVSHAAATNVQPLGVLGDAFHLCAAGVWIGGLVPLAIFLTAVRRSFSLGKNIAPILQRFSTLSLASVSVLIVSGISNSCLLVGCIQALFTTIYGWLLLLKLTLFVVLLGFGALNRFAVKIQLLNSQRIPDLLGRVRRNVICEACLGSAILIIVACLGVTPPARP
jgi:copper resistance protein D